MPGALPDAYANAVPGAMHVRTDVLTNGYLPGGAMVPLGNARRGGAPTLLGMLTGSVVAAIAAPAAPHPVIRRAADEPRRPIDPRVREFVYDRDGHRCLWCGVSRGDYEWTDERKPCDLKPHCYPGCPGWHPVRRPVAFHLDHIVPWSAGGSDHPDNLRTFCARCNRWRGNRAFRVDLPAPLPLTIECTQCPPEYLLPGKHVTDGPAFCWWCRTPSIALVVAR